MQFVITSTAIPSTMTSTNVTLASIAPLSANDMSAMGMAPRTHGCIDKAVLERHVPELKKTTVIMCGPSEFMLAMEGKLAKVEWTSVG
jgi:ferredoxin-NADP reductase